MQALTERYAHITTTTGQFTITLSREQQVAVLAAYDYGIQAMSAETLAILDTVLNQIKTEIHP